MRTCPSCNEPIVQGRPHQCRQADQQASSDNAESPAGELVKTGIDIGTELIPQRAAVATTVVASGPAQAAPAELPVPESGAFEPLADAVGSMADGAGEAAGGILEGIGDVLGGLFGS